MSSPYSPAGNLLNQLWKSKKRGLKSIVYNSDGELTVSKTTYAQCLHVLQNKTVLDGVLASNKKIIQAKNEGLLYVLLYELLLGPNKKIKGGGALKRQLMKHQSKLEKTLHEIQPKSKFNDTTTTTTIPRYVRINTLVTSTNKVLSKLLKKTQDVYIDPHVPDLIVMEPTATSRQYLQDFVLNKEVVLQDKSSCFSALCLVHGFNNMHPINGDVLDACAAPGNKTCHLAALLSSSTSSNSQVYALDKSPDRFKELERRMKELTKGKVQCHNLDYLSTSSETTVVSDKDNSSRKKKPKQPFSNITAILLDPSCSGSGMSTQNKNDGNDTEGNKFVPSFTNDRIRSLANFQLQALRHATNSEKFPSVERVVYSTCSIYKEENEYVVQRFLNGNSAIDDENDWELIAPKCLQNWKRRGIFDPTSDDDDTSGADDDGQNQQQTQLTKEQTKCLIRVNPNEDGTNGFFVACFQKKKPKRFNNGIGGDGNKYVYEGPILPKDMKFYHNQFDTSGDSHGGNNDDGGDDEVTPSVAIDGKKRKQSSVTNDDENSPHKKLKNDENKKDATTSSTTTASSNINKKKAKKLEWKRKQRLKKLKRLNDKKRNEEDENKATTA